MIVSQYSFLLQPLIAIFLVSIACGLLGPWIMINRLSFLTGGVAHASYGGVGIALFMGWWVLPTTVFFATLMGVVFVVQSRDRSERTDNLIGVLWVLGMSVGLVLLSSGHVHWQDFAAYIFGDILSVSSSLNQSILVANLFFALFIWKYFHQLLSVSFDPEYARTRGVSVFSIRLILVIFISVFIVLLMQLVGLLLVVALLTIPSLIAELHTQKMDRLMLFSGIWTLLGCISGMAVSMYFNVGTGASIVLSLAALWVIMKTLDKTIHYGTSGVEVP